VSLADARRVIDAALAEAEQLRAEVTVAVVDNGGHALSLARMDGSAFHAIRPALAKAATSAATGSSTEELGQFLSGDPVALAGFTGQPGLSVLPGGLPILDSSGTVAGGIGVAGAPATVERQIGMAGLAALTAQTAASSSD
jgi:glc operon protein GlcG